MTEPTHPTTAYLELTNGQRIDCSITEQDKLDGDGDGNRVFILTPVRLLKPNEGVASGYLDVLPAMSTAQFEARWEDGIPRFAIRG